MADVQTYSADAAVVRFEVDGNVLPMGCGIFSAVIREDVLYTVPMLDVIICDTIGAIGQQIKLLDGTKIVCSISYNSKDVLTPLTFKVANIKPSKIGVQTYYLISAYFLSDLLQPKSVWSFSGNLGAAFQNIIETDVNVQPVNFVTNYINENKYDNNTLRKLATQSFARYIRSVLLPCMTQRDVSYWAYYHNGYECRLMDLLKLLSTYEYKNDAPALMPSTFLQWSLSSPSFTKNVTNSSYGGSSWQYDAETGEWNEKADAVGYAKYNTNIDSTVKNKQVNVASSSTGNHPIDYLASVNQNTKNNGAFNIELIVQINYATNFQGLDIVPVFYEKGKYIPFVLAGKSIIMRNGMYEEQLKLIANQIDQSILSTLGTSMQR